MKKAILKVNLELLGELAREVLEIQKERKGDPHLKRIKEILQKIELLRVENNQEEVR